MDTLILSFFTGKVWCCSWKTHKLGRTNTNLSSVSFLLKIMVLHKLIFGKTTEIRQRVKLLLSSEQPSRDARFFCSHIGDLEGASGSQRLCGRRRKPRLEPDVRSSRFVIVREIPNATPFRVATFTRTIPSVPSNVKRDAYRTFSHRDACSEEVQLPSFCGVSVDTRLGM